MSHTMVSLPQDVVARGLEAQSKYLWLNGITLAREVAAGARKVTKVVVWCPQKRDSVYSLLWKDMVFGSRQDHMVLADPHFWCAPLHLYLRLTCAWQGLETIQSCCEGAKLRDPDNKDALYWTIWLHSQGIRHLDYLENSR